MNKAVVVGSCNVDFTVFCDRAPVSGETVSGNNLVIGPGGKGLNQATALCRSGTQTAYICRIGSDFQAQIILNHFRKEKISTKYLSVSPDTCTGSASITVEGSGQNRITVVPGANAEIRPEDVEHAADIISDADVLLLQLESSIDASLRAAQIARQSGTTVILNPAPAKPIPPELLSLTDILIPNETEAEAITGIPANDMQGVRSAAKALKQLGIPIVILTLGNRGSYVLTDTAESLVPAFKVEAKDTTAAGDQFCGALASAISRGEELILAVRFATAASAISVTRVGASISMAHRDEIEAFLSANHSSNDGGIFSL